MRLSRSTCCQPSWRASRRAAVDLPLPMNPVRQTSLASANFAGHQFRMRLALRERRNQLRLRMLIVPSKELSSTLARPELKDPNRRCRISRYEMLVGGGDQLRFVVHFALQRSRAQIEGIAGRKAHFDHAAVVLQAVGAVGQEFAVEENISLGGLRPHVIAAQVDQPETPADRGNFEPPGAADALERAAHGLHGKVARSVVQIDARARLFRRSCRPARSRRSRRRNRRESAVRRLRER